MVAVLFFLAFLALAGGVALFVADSRERDGAAEHNKRSEHTRRSEPAKRSEPARRGSNRRARKLWARRHGFAFPAPQDSFAGQWHRGAAAGGAAPQDVATGTAFGHDTVVAELGGVGVVAMRTGEESDVVVDFRREHAAHTDKEHGSDLVQIDPVGQFSCWTTHPSPVRRFVDTRVITALEEMPPQVTAVWFEGEWVLAQCPDPAAQDFHEVFAPLALLADAARTLPPRVDRPLELPFGVGWAPEVVVDKQTEPDPVQRPEDPVELPTRRTGGERGWVEDREVGGDDVAAIVGEEHRCDLTRVRRMQKPPSIFEDEDDKNEEE